MSNLMCCDADMKLLNSVYQWDANREINISGIPLSESYTYEIHMWNMRNNLAFVLTPTITDAQMAVTIPTPLLETPDVIHICVVKIDEDSGEVATVGELSLHVIVRERPSDYASLYTDNPDLIADGLMRSNNMVYLSNDGVPFGDGVDV